MARRRRNPSPTISPTISTTSLALAFAALALAIGVLLAPPGAAPPRSLLVASPPASPSLFTRPPFGGGVGLRREQADPVRERREGCARVKKKAGLAVSISRARPPHTHPQPSPPPPTHGTWDAIDGDWIVRFTAYKHSHEHVAALAESLGPPTPTSWAWVDRANPAAALPTDFGVIRLGGGSKLTKVNERMSGVCERARTGHATRLLHLIILNTVSSTTPVRPRLRAGRAGRPPPAPPHPGPGLV